MSAGPLVVTYPLTGRSRAIVAEELSGAAAAIYLVDLAPADRADALGRAGAVLSHDTSKELRPDEIPLIRNARLLQFTAAGVDWAADQRDGTAGGTARLIDAYAFGSDPRRYRPRRAALLCRRRPSAARAADPADPRNRGRIPDHRPPRSGDGLNPHYQRARESRSLAALPDGGRGDLIGALGRHAASALVMPPLPWPSSS